MDKSSLIGVLIGLTCMYLLGHEASHGHWAMFISVEGVIAVFGGSISVVFMAMPLEKLKCLPGWIRRFMFYKGQGSVEIIRLISKLGEKARRDGILALEPELKNLQDNFLASGLRMAIDGSSPEIIEETLRMEILSMQERHKAGKKFFDLIKLYGPGWGLVATLIGQIGMFGQLGGSVEAMGKALALAVTATMYGTLLANAVAGPMGDKLGLRSTEEIVKREMILQGVLSLHAGDNPRVTIDKMMAFVPAVQRDKLKAAA
ncbi:MAG: Chemotaxis protein PomA [Phycisphaerae bacterium]|nr:Chemotaxis protein PomA [Phycisphaerae bacterium]